eukprot:6206346-Pleurochrysis_carterae.AAC.1
MSRYLEKRAAPLAAARAGHLSGALSLLLPSVSLSFSFEMSREGGRSGAAPAQKRSSASACTERLSVDACSRERSRRPWDSSASLLNSVESTSQGGYRQSRQRAQAPV